MANIEDFVPIPSVVLPVKGTPEWSAAHGHGDGCPFDECPDDDPSWNCPKITACGTSGCICEFVLM